MLLGGPHESERVRLGLGSQVPSPQESTACNYNTKVTGQDWARAEDQLVPLILARDIWRYGQFWEIQN